MRTGAPTVYRAVARPSSSSASRIAASAASQAPRTSLASCWSRRAAPLSLSASRRPVATTTCHAASTSAGVSSSAAAAASASAGASASPAKPGRRLVGPAAQVGGRPQQRRHPGRRGQFLARGQPDRGHPRPLGPPAAAGRPVLAAIGTGGHAAGRHAGGRHGAGRAQCRRPRSPRHSTGPHAGRAYLACPGSRRGPAGRTQRRGQRRRARRSRARCRPGRRRVSRRCHARPGQSCAARRRRAGPRRSLRRLASHDRPGGRWQTRSRLPVVR